MLSVKKLTILLVLPLALAGCDSFGKKKKDIIPGERISVLALEKQLEPIEFTFDLRFEMRGQGTAIAGLKFFQPVAPIAAQRLVSADALTE